MLWDLVQAYRIRSANERTRLAHEQAARSVGLLSAQVNELDRQVAGLVLSCQALWELSRESQSFSNEKVWEKVREIDLRDGVEDGRMTMDAVTCPNCRVANNPSHVRCLICGNTLN